MRTEAPRARMWMKIGVAFAVLWLGACIQAPVRVDVTTEETSRLADVRTFALVPTSAPQPRVGERIEEEIRAGLGAQGLGEVPIVEADVAVTYRTTRERGRRLANVPNPEGGDLSVPQDFTEKTIEIDVTDPRTDELLWRGIGEIDVVNRSSEPQAAAKVVREVLDRYPGPNAP